MNHTFEVNLRLDSKYLPNNDEPVHAREMIVMRSLRAMGKTRHRREDQGFGAIRWFIAEVASAGWNEKTIYRLAERIGQDAISVYDPRLNVGAVIGPRAKSYGEFRITRFGRYDSDLTKSDYDKFDPCDDENDAQGQHDQAMASRGKLEPGSKQRLEALLKTKVSPVSRKQRIMHIVNTDPIAQAMADDPGLNRELS